MSQTPTLIAAHARQAGNLILIEVRALDGIEKIVADFRGSLMESVSVANRMVLWFTHSTESAYAHHNAMATELLLITTDFTARDVPLLRGDVVFTGRDASGGPASLTEHQLDILTHVTLSGRERRILIRRLSKPSNVFTVNEDNRVPPPPSGWGRG